MSEEPLFLEDETLVDNLDEVKAKRVINWLMLVNKVAPQDLEHALYIVREINRFYQDRTDEEREDHLIHIEPDCRDSSFCLSDVNDSDIFDRIMSQLEEKYG